MRLLISSHRRCVRTSAVTPCQSVQQDHNSVVQYKHHVMLVWHKSKILCFFLCCRLGAEDPGCGSSLERAQWMTEMLDSSLQFMWVPFLRIMKPCRWRRRSIRRRRKLCPASCKN